MTPRMPSSRRRVSAAPSRSSRIRSPALSCTTRSRTESHSGVAYSGVAAHIQVQARAVGQEDVAGPAPRHHPAEQVAGHLVGAEPALAAKRAGDAVLVLEPEDAALHACTLLPAPHHRARRGPETRSRVRARERPAGGWAIRCGRAPRPDRRRRTRTCPTPCARAHGGVR